MVETIFVDADDGLATRVNASLSACGCFFDAEFGKTGFDSLGHAAEFLNLLDMLPCALSDFIGQSLYIVGTGPGIDLLGDHGLFLDIDLSVSGDTSREVCRQGDSFVEGVGVERLGVAKCGAHRFDTCTAHVVEGILLCE